MATTVIASSNSTTLFSFLPSPCLAYHTHPYPSLTSPRSSCSQTSILPFPPPQPSFFFFFSSLFFFLSFSPLSSPSTPPAPSPSLSHQRIQVISHGAHANLHHPLPRPDRHFLCQHNRCHLLWTLRLVIPKVARCPTPLANRYRHPGFCLLQLSRHPPSHSAPKVRKDHACLH